MSNRQWLMQFTEDKTGGALFSPCRQWRYTLWRYFYPGKIMPRAVNFILLNPSTADELQNDPTVARCEVRAREWGFDALVVTNLFAWRSTDPRALEAVTDPVGPDNDYHLTHNASMGAALVVCGWGGSRPLIRNRASHVVELLREADVSLTYLRMSENSGQPWHPLYLPYSEQPKEWAI